MEPNRERRYTESSHWFIIRERTLPEYSIVHTVRCAHGAAAFLCSYESQSPRTALGEMSVCPRLSEVPASAAATLAIDYDARGSIGVRAGPHTNSPSFLPDLTAYTIAQGPPQPRIIPDVYCASTMNHCRDLRTRSTTLSAIQWWHFALCSVAVNRQPASIPHRRIVRAQQSSLQHCEYAGPGCAICA